MCLKRTQEATNKRNPHYSVFFFLFFKDFFFGSVLMRQNVNNNWKKWRCTKTLARQCRCVSEWLETGIGKDVKNHSWMWKADLKMLPHLHGHQAWSGWTQNGKKSQRTSSIFTHVFTQGGKQEEIRDLSAFLICKLKSVFSQVRMFITLWVYSMKSSLVLYHKKMQWCLMNGEELQRAITLN